MDNNKIVFLEGKKVILRPFELEDLSLITQFVNDPEVRFLLDNAYPKSRFDEEKWLKNKSTQKDDFMLGIIAKEDNKLIGGIGLHKINWIHRTAYSGTMIGDKEYWDKGYGTDAKMIILYHAFNILNLRKVSSWVCSENKRSINYLQKCGYKIEGRLEKQFYSNNDYHDEIILSVFKDDWISLWGRYNKK